MANAVDLRKRLLQFGAHTLTDAELVAVLLSPGRADGQSAAGADRLLRAVGGVPGLERCHPEALCRLPGLGEVTAARLSRRWPCRLRPDTMGTVTIPSGDPTPSQDDRNTTARCRNAADVTGLRFLGHLVLGEHDSWEQA